MAGSFLATRSLRRVCVVAFASMSTAALWITSGPDVTAPWLMRTLAAEPPSAAADQELLLKNRDRWQAETRRLQTAGKYDEAIAAAKNMLAAERVAYGDHHADVAGSLEVLETLYLLKDDVATARRMLDERIVVIEKLPPTDPWVLADLHVRQFDLEQLGNRTAQERRELTSLDEAESRAIALYGQQEYQEAAQLAEEIVGRRQRLYPVDRFPDGHRDLATSLHNLASLLRSIGDDVRAADFQAQAVEMCRRVYSVDRYPAGHPDLATSLNNLGSLLNQQGEFARATDYVQQAVEMYQRLYPAERYPEGHPDLAIALDLLGGALNDQGDRIRAAECIQQSLEMYQRLYPRNGFPQGHPVLANALSHLGAVLMEQGDYTRANVTLQQALTMNQRLYAKNRFPEGHPALADSLNILGLVIQREGDYAHASGYLQRAEEMYRRVYAADGSSPELRNLATNLNNQGLLVQREGDYVRAADYYRQALDICRRLYSADRFPQGHPDLAMALNNLGGVLKDQREYRQAADYYGQALEMQQRLFPSDRYPLGHPGLAISLNNLGSLLSSQGDNVGAANYYQQSLRIVQRFYPTDHYPQGHPSLTLGLHSLGRVLKDQGEYVRAADYVQQALEMDRRLFPKDRYPLGHPDLARSLNNLGIVLATQGEYARAMDLLEAGVEMQAGLSEAYLAAVGEAQAMMLLSTLPSNQAALLSATRHLPASHDRAYAALWTMKGAVARVETARRKKLAGGSDPRTRAIAEQLQDTRRELASLMLAPVETDPTKAEQAAARVNDLTHRKESLERQLAGQVPDFAKQLQSARRKHFDLIAVLPADLVVVDLLRYSYYEQDSEVPGQQGERETPSYVAFVLQRGQPVVRVELGPAEPIDSAVDAWRRRLAPGDDDGVGATPTNDLLPPDMSPDAQLRLLVWEPLERVFAVGTMTVVLSPDAQLTAIPWNALPGRAGGNVLLEEYALATVPNGQFLLEQLSAEVSQADPRDRLLTVGSVNYDDPAQPTPAKSEPLAAVSDPLARRDAAMDDAQQFTWHDLKGTQDEVQRILTLSSVPSTVPLAGAEASEDRVLEELPTVRYAHFATHGFFSPSRIRGLFQDDPQDSRRTRTMLFDAERRVALGRSPLVMSGLVLAGANQPRKTNEWGVTIGNDGILTAEEIVGLELAKLDLAVLSACETGLGQVSGGEGVFGLQRAFHLAGTRNVVASLWKVDDQATAALMGLFYEKLWKERRPAIQALREAQLAIYRHPELIGQLTQERGQSFAKTVDLVDGGRRAAGGKSTDPRLWAAWVLSGLGL